MVAPLLGEEPLIRRITRAEYDRLIDLGFFHEDEHIELLEGALVRMSPQGDEHAFVIVSLNRLFAAAFAGRALVWPQLPLALSGDSEPEPDMALVPLAAARKRKKPSKAYLVVEVAVSSVAFDLSTKARLYARARVPEYWVVQPTSRSILVHRRPQRGRYRIVTEHVAGGFVDVQALAGPRFKVADIVGR